MSTSSAKVLYVSSEVNPYTPDGYIGMISRYLPQQIQESGMQVRIFMPRYGIINERRGQLHEVIRLSGMNLIIAQSDHQLIIKVASISGARLQVYFIDNQDFFARKALLTDEQGNQFEDNDCRAMFFSRGVIETIKKLRWAPDLIHTHGWIASITPAYITKVFKNDPMFSHSKLVVSLYDDAFEGTLAPDLTAKLKKEGIKSSFLNSLTEPTYLNLMRFAIENSAGVVVCSEKVDSSLIEYAKELGLPVIYDTEPKEFDKDNNLTTDIATLYKPFYEEILSK